MTAAFTDPEGFYHSISNVRLDENFTLASVRLSPSKKSPIAMNHYTTIGMPISGDTVDEMSQCVKTILADRKNLMVVSVPEINDEDCYYLVYPSRSGGQLWGPVHRRSHFGGFVPHFEGKSRVRICVLSKSGDPFVTDDGTTFEEVLEGRFLGVWDEDGMVLDILKSEGQIELHKMAVMSKSGEGAIFSGYGFMDRSSNACFLAFDFECPNFGFFGVHTPTPVAAMVQLSGFAREVQTFDSLEEYKSSKSKDEIKFASQFFGTESFNDGMESGLNRNGTFALIVGHVLESELRSNELTGQPFYWALVQTAGGMEIDVVMHPTLLEGFGIKPPQVGGVLLCYCWLSGLLLSVSSD
ncbi:expressed unknown protein [Seminavis robusta]|uniref:Uncharacterized protein n=1 Tax=Seminavis robusta TaxID=568900 RepID=A0A9N8E8Q4_9STRA|nr:expressed unknown protein [Seminavis robusta]|eukprot:Sro795_g203610.1 n/a (354) ;mRNA; f:40696-41757